jgi:hypothetical protein
MSGLTEEEVLCETFRRRAENFRQKSRQTNFSVDVWTYAAFASMLQSVVQDLCFEAGITLPVEAPQGTEADKGPADQQTPEGAQ